MVSNRPLGLLLLLASVMASAQTQAPWRVLKSGQKSTETHARRIVLQTEAKFNEYWQQEFGTAKPPKVRWDRERVVAIHLGHRGSSGYSVVISDVTLEGDSVVVYWKENLPAPRVKVREVQTSPYTLIAIPTSNSHVKFVSGVHVPGNEFASGDAYPQKIFLSGGHSLVSKEATLVVEDSSTLSNLWGNAFGRGTQPPPADFNKVRLAAIFLAQRPTPGYDIVIKRIARIGPHEIDVQYTETKPPKDAILPQLITNPFVIVELPNQGETVTITKV